MRQVIRDYGSDAIILTGHSLGGALANILGQRSGVQTITFNAPPVDVFTVHAQSLGTKVSAALGTPPRIDQDQPSNIVNVRLEGDPVSGLPGRQTGRTIEISAEPQSGFKSPLDILAQPVETHGMEAVEKWLRRASQ